MARRLTVKQIEEIIELFISGINIEDLSKRFNYTKLTISRNLKKKLGVEKYKQLNKENKRDIESFDNEKLETSLLSKNKKENNTQISSENFETDSNKYNYEELSSSNIFMEIAPLNCDIEDTPQKELTSLPIKDFIFPKIVYMIVDKKIELEIKNLKDYPKWQFLSEEDLKRKAIEIFYDLKVAKSFCNKEQKVIKVPNTSIFKKVAPILLSRGISRIVSSDKLIAL